MTNREIEDLIQPGEFQWCRRCGWCLVLGNECCGDCETPPDRLRAAATHAALKLKREQLAESRKAAGLKPLFWMTT